MGWPGSGSCTRWWPPMPRTQRRWRSGSKPTAARWSGPWLREFYPGALAALGAQLAEPEALGVLALAPTPEQGRQLTRAAIRRALVGAGRRRNLQTRVVAIHDGLAAPQLAAPDPGREYLP
jgi:hypothetical protein